MSATFRVPEAPRRGGQLLYFFPALESASGGGRIIQPVLRFYDGAWSIASHSVANGEDDHSAVVSTEAGHAIRGTLRSSSCDADGSCMWTITTADVTSGETTTLTEKDSTAYTLYFAGAVEGYHVTSCSQYPGDGAVRFENVAVYDEKGDELPIAPDRWTSTDASPECGFGTAVRESTVTFFFDRGCPIGC